MDQLTADATIGPGLDGAAVTLPAPLAGLRVVECASFVAAPTAGLSLAQLGADVIRIDPLGGAADYRRWPISSSGVSLYWAGLNKQKRSVALDLRSGEGRELAVALATAPGDDAGIFVTNQAARPWHSDEVLRARRSDLIYLQLTGRPDRSTAVDYTVNARSGFPLVTGVGDDPVNHALPAWDLLAGLYAATAILAADRQRRIHGNGQHLSLALSDVALAAAGNLGWLAEAQLGVDRSADGNFVYGTFGRDFPTSDGRRVMVVAVTTRQWQALVDCAGIGAAVAALAQATGESLADEGSRYRQRDALAALLAPWFLSLPAAEVRDRVTAAGGLCEVYQSFLELVRSDPEFVRADDGGLLDVLDQPGVGPHLAPRSPIGWSIGEPVQLRPAAECGADTWRVLQGVLGLDDRELEALSSRGVIPEANNILCP